MSLKELLNLIKTHESVEMIFNNLNISYKVNGNQYRFNSSDEAYKKVRKFLDENDLGFTKDRELDKVELIADSYRYTDVGCLLHL